MKIRPQCASCLLSRVHYEAGLSTDNQRLIERAVREALKTLNENFNYGRIATEVSTAIHRTVYDVLGDPDPYREIKRRANRIALSLYPSIKKIVLNHEDPFRASAIASIAGNSFDYGVLGYRVEEENLKDAFTTALKKGLAIDHLDRIVDKLHDVVYITDNCGEIVFDKLFIEQLKKRGARITLLVKGQPILTDATEEDVREASLTEVVDDVITTGTNAVGVSPDEMPEESMRKLKRASLIIAKGMANYESLSDREFNPVLYMLRAKCEPVAESLGVRKGDFVAMLAP